MDRLKDIFREYELLAAEADSAFEKIQKDYGSCVKCDVQCSDCCNSVFGIFFVESVYISYQFSRLDRKIRRELLLRGDKADKDLLEVEKRLGAYSDPQEQALAMSRERVRCPLLDERDKCSLYPVRPVTCRAYGIPTVISGAIHACWKAGFERGQSYPYFDLDEAYRKLYLLSCNILEIVGNKDMERASLLVSLSKSIRTPAERLLSEGY
ncbi:MAG: YkgJ family cysteine cluster protein [Desulfocucumaceae bacterium]